MSLGARVLAAPEYQLAAPQAMGKGKHQGGGRARSAEEIEADEGAPAKDDRKFGGRGVGGQSATAA